MVYIMHCIGSLLTFIGRRQQHACGNDAVGNDLGELKKQQITLLEKEMGLLRYLEP
jgi:hypothetical protein